MKAKEWLLGCGGSVFAVIAVTALVGIVVAVAFLGSWCNAAISVVSPQNVRTQFKDAYTSYESLRAAGVNICNAKKAYEAETDNFYKTQRQTQLLAYEAAYQRIESTYDAQMDDVFRGRVVGPPDLPKQAPTVDQRAKDC